MKGRIPVALAATALLVGAGSAWAAFTPEAGSPYPTGAGPYGVYAADFNRDGRLDLATANGDSAPGTSSVYIRQPQGGYVQEPGSPFPSGTTTGSVGDFNGDGFPDLAVADFTFSQGVAVLLRSPAGGFTQQTVPVGEPLSDVAVGDFNGDQLSDLAVARINSSGLNISIYLRDGAGFTAAGSYAAGFTPRKIAVADFDGNGQLDLAVANQGSNTVTILLGTGGGAFTSEGSVAVGAGPAGIAAADFDGNGRPDIAVSNGAAGTVSVLLRNGDNNGFDEDVGSPITVSLTPVTVTTADFDRNGTPDIAVAASEGLEILRRGAGGFVRDAPTPVTGSPVGVAAGDLNGDGVPDAAVTSLGTNELHILLSPSPPPVPTPVPPVPTPTPTATPIAPPTINKTVNAQPVSGKVRVKLPKTSKYINLAEAKQLPNGTSIDARDGRVTITAAAGKGKTDKADFYDGLFQIAQSKGTTTLTLTEALDCKKAKKSASAAAKKPKTRKLWGDGKGKFRTRGQYSAATIRGTRWLVQDGCGTTKTTVKQGSVNVRDEVKKKTVIVRKGRSYTARAKKR